LDRGSHPVSAFTSQPPMSTQPPSVIVPAAVKQEGGARTGRSESMTRHRSPRDVMSHAPTNAQHVADRHAKVPASSPQYFTALSPLLCKSPFSTLGSWPRVSTGGGKTTVGATHPALTFTEWRGVLMGQVFPHLRHQPWGGVSHDSYRHTATLNLTHQSARRLNLTHQKVDSRGRVACGADSC
jgi:hypothetical protein